MAQGDKHEEYEDLDIWLIKIMCEHVGVLKQSSFMHSLFAHEFNFGFFYSFCVLTAKKRRSIPEPGFKILFTACITNIHLNLADSRTCGTRKNLQKSNARLKISSFIIRYLQP